MTAFEIDDRIKEMYSGACEAFIAMVRGEAYGKHFKETCSEKQIEKAIAYHKRMQNSVSGWYGAPQTYNMAVVRALEA